MRNPLRESSLAISIARILPRPLAQIFVQFFRYGLSGTAAAVAHLSVLVALVELVGVLPTIATSVGFVCGCIVNYTLQHQFVFQRSRGHVRHFPRYVAVTAFTMGLNAALFWVLIHGLGIYYVAAQVIATGLIVPLNFTINRCFTFADLSAKQEA